jgi:glycosyltransferase involved in cell wall biosynthesis
MSQPLVSFVMPVYNGLPFVLSSIKSILNQSYPNIELILINDGSTDGSDEIMEQIATLDNRVRLFSHSNIGLTKSLNKGIALARGEYIARQDADDLSQPTRIATQLPWLENTKFDLCCSRAIIYETGRITPKYTFFLPKKFQSRFMNPFIHGTFLVKKSALEMVGGYDEDFVFAQDYRLTKMLYERRCRIKYLKDPLYTLRISTGAKHRDKQNYYASRVRLQIDNDR